MAISRDLSKISKSRFTSCHLKSYRLLHDAAKIKKKQTNPKWYVKTIHHNVFEQVVHFICLIILEIHTFCHIELVN